MEHCAKDAGIILFKRAVPVGKIQLGRFTVHPAAVGGEIADGFQHILHFAAVSTGVHVDGTAHRAGDAIGKFQPGVAVLEGKFAQLGKFQTCRCRNIIAVGILINRQSHSRCFGRNINDCSSKALIRKQDVAAIAQQVIADLRLFAELNGLTKLIFIPRHHKQVGRAANAESAVCRERLVFFIKDSSRLQLLLELFHGACSFSPVYRPDPDGSAAPWPHCNPSFSGGC